MDDEPTVFEWAGGLPALTRMTRIFYATHAPQDPLLTSLFAHSAPDHPERVAKWLAEVFGGPAAYSEEFGGYSQMLSEHLGKALTEEMRARWVELLMRSANDAGLPNDPEFRGAPRLTTGGRRSPRSAGPSRSKRTSSRCSGGWTATA